MKPFGARRLTLGALLIPFGLAPRWVLKPPAASPSHNPLATMAGARRDNAGTLKMVLILVPWRSLAHLDPGPPQHLLAQPWPELERSAPGI